MFYSKCTTYVFLCCCFFVFFLLFSWYKTTGSEYVYKKEYCYIIFCICTTTKGLLMLSRLVMIHHSSDCEVSLFFFAHVIGILCYLRYNAVSKMKTDFAVAGLLPSRVIIVLSVLTVLKGTTRWRNLIKCLKLLYKLDVFFLKKHIRKLFFIYILK